ncbi:nucleoside phosphorylase/phosphoribosyltransferase catalytic domain-containing protein [Sporormia fimetaria CBS 119925]|uniref:Nucleoside phosphorylase/phosphoribosyltransferase catalytic domain-containing protein n=1 Tax=Sporormia fimetaria CBS 119925 TaxID=1340428 RepID=A0A6A6V753_9PLEO|nr:nucleoside phosphorylase/phosphoribosyltransferase catalytic domain-containing protein [Sporormia fimetaria CBS 119925]
MASVDTGTEDKVSITPLLKRLWHESPSTKPTADEIAAALGLVFTNSLSEVQTGALLTCLHFTDLDRQAEILAKCARAMLDASINVDMPALKKVIERRGRKEGNYHGGLCDIVGTGGDSHNTFNISTTSSILASSLLLIAKHGNKASTSRSGSADLLSCVKPRSPVITAVAPSTVTEIYSETNYAFLFAPIFHPGARHAASIRRQLGWRTIFNLLGPLVNPLHELIEARVLGVARKEIGPDFAESLRRSGCRKGMIICGDEELDELSCAGPTHCWRLEENRATREVDINYFTVSPADFGVPAHPLSEVSPGQSPERNAEILISILKGDVPPDDPILHFVLINTAALLVVSGICDADESNMGHGDDGKVIKEVGPGGGRWKEGVRRAQWAINSGEAYRQWEAFVEVTNKVA